MVNYVQLLLHTIQLIFIILYQLTHWSSSDLDLSQRTWKVHEELSLMIDDLNRDIPHPGRRRHQAQWKAQSTPVNTYNAALPANQQISIANGFFYQNGYSIRPDYQSAMVSIYQSTLQRLDFANKPELSTKFINRFESIHWKSVFDPI